MLPQSSSAAISCNVQTWSLTPAFCYAKATDLPEMFRGDWATATCGPAHNQPVTTSGDLRPTPTGLRGGRITLAIVAALVGVLVVLLALDPGFRDPSMLAITGTTIVSGAGFAIAYLGQPTLTRYRVGLIVITIGVLASFWLLVASPLPPV